LRGRRRGSEPVLSDCHTGFVHDASESPGHARDAAFAAVGSHTMKGTQKPKKLGKKPAQKTLKERRTEKRAAAKHSRSLELHV
jgi:hypothetical protein